MTRGFYEPRTLTPNLIEPLSRNDGAGLVDGWGFARHGDFFLRYFNPEGTPRADVPEDQIRAATRLFGADEKAQRIFLTSRMDHQDVVDFMVDADATMANASVEVTSYSGDAIRIVTRSSVPVWLSYIDNWDANWVARVDDRDVTIERLFGAYKSIRLPAAESRAVMSYRPALLP